MPTMTPELWAERYTRLRPYVHERWPEVDGGKLNAIVGDFDALVDVVATTAGTAHDVAREDLLSIDVDDGDLADDGGEHAASLEQLRLGPGFSQDERERIVGELAKLERRLRRFPADATELEISVQDRDQPSQEVVLEAWLPKFSHMAAKSHQDDLGQALREVRDAMWRQIDDAVNRRKDRR
jgi:hypothetical protein